jgi:hypothetical protein
VFLKVLFLDDPQQVQPTVASTPYPGGWRGDRQKSEDQPHAKGTCPSDQRFLTRAFTERTNSEISRRLFEGILIALRCSRRHSAVHPATAVRHRWRLARVPAPRSGSASRAEVHGQLHLHCVVPLVSRSPPPGFRSSPLSPDRLSGHGRGTAPGTTGFRR